jgi:hypothetical protein
MYFILTEVYLYVSQYTCNIWFMQKTVISKLTFETWIQNKGNAKRGVSPRIKIWPGDLDRWPWKSIGFQILLSAKYVPSLVKIH